MLKYFSISIILLWVFSFASCEPDNGVYGYSDYKPILAQRSELDALVVLQPPKEIDSTKNFYLYQDYLFLIEINSGIHVIDNTDISNPTNIAFISTPYITGADLSIYNDYLYINQGVDMLIIKFVSSTEIEFIGRVENAFLEITPDELPLQDKYIDNRPDNTIAIGWELIQDDETI